MSVSTHLAVADPGIHQGEAVTAVDESPPQGKKIFHLQITVCEFYFIFGELKWIFF